jgi:sulfur carrier protein ThiS
MRVHVNDEPRETAAAHLAALLQELGVAQVLVIRAAQGG